MKKLLLLATIATVVSTASAAKFNEIFRIVNQGNTIENGQTITVRDYYDPILRDYPDHPEWSDGKFEAEDTIIAYNLTEKAYTLDFALSRVEPSLSDFPISGSAIGSFSLCYNFSDGLGQCLNATGDVIKPDLSQFEAVNPEQHLELSIHQQDFTNLTPLRLKLDLSVIDNGIKVPDSEMTLFIEFTHTTDVTAAVDGVFVDENAPAEFFNLHGQKIAQPRKGDVYIVRKGSKVAKHIF